MKQRRAQRKGREAKRERKKRVTGAEERHSRGGTEERDWLHSDCNSLPVKMLQGMCLCLFQVYMQKKLSSYDTCEMMVGFLLISLKQVIFIWSDFVKALKSLSARNNLTLFWPTSTYVSFSLSVCHIKTSISSLLGVCFYCALGDLHCMYTEGE